MHAVRRIAEEIAVSRECIREIALAVLDSKFHKSTASEIITTNIRRANDAELELFIKIYDQHIRYVCNSRKYYLGAETDDCMQFIRMVLCKIYHKKYMYTNFDKVVKAVIKRKAIDFSKARNCDIKGLVNESDFFTDSSGENDSDLDDVGNFMHDRIAVTTHNTYYEFGRTIKALSKMVSEDPTFSKWDRVLIKKVSRCVAHGEHDITKILEKIDGNRTEVKFRFNMMVKRIRTNINKDLFI